MLFIALCVICTEQRYFELEKQQLSDHIRLEAESKAAADFRLQVLDLGE